MKYQTILILSLVAGAGCAKKTAKKALIKPTCDASSKLEWDATEQKSVKYNYVLNEKTVTCVKQILPLNNFEKGLDNRRRNKITCTPQAIGKVTLKASDNFYSYRNDRIFLQLNGENGDFWRITVGENKKGEKTFSRDYGCFYVKNNSFYDRYYQQTGQEQMIYLDLGDTSASTEETFSGEVFKYQITGKEWKMFRVDQTFYVDNLDCPRSKVPTEFCSTGDLKKEAILIKSEFSFTNITFQQMDAVWDDYVKNAIETSVQNFKYSPKFTSDLAEFNQFSAWKDYFTNMLYISPYGGDLLMEDVCYPTVKKINRFDGTVEDVSIQSCYNRKGNYYFM